MITIGETSYNTSWLEQILNDNPTADIILKNGMTFKGTSISIYEGWVTVENQQDFIHIHMNDISAIKIKK